MTDTKQDNATAEKLAAVVRPAEDEDAPGAPGVDTPGGAEKTADGDSAPAETAQDEPGPLTKEDGTPFTRADLDGLQAALKAARREARDAKKALAEREARAGDDRPVEEVVAEVEQAATAKWKPLMVRAAARAAFAEAGLALPAGRVDEALARAVRLLDEDALTISEDGLVEGLSEQVEAIRSDFPDLFTTARRVVRVDAGDKPAAPKAPQTAASRLAAHLTRVS